MAPVHAPTLKKPFPGTHLSVYQTNSTLNVLRIVYLKLVDIHDMTFPQVPYKLSLPIKNTFTPHCFFLILLILSFSSHTFWWACGSLCEPWKFFFFMHSLVYRITHSILNGFKPNLCEHFSHVCFACHAIFNLK